MIKAIDPDAQWQIQSTYSENQDLIDFISGITRLLLGIRLDPVYESNPSNALFVPLPAIQRRLPISLRSRRYLSEIVMRIVPIVEHRYHGTTPVSLDCIGTLRAEDLDDPLYRLMEDFEREMGRNLSRSATADVEAFPNPNVTVHLQKCIQEEVENNEFVGTVRDALLKRTQEKTKVEVVPEVWRK
jgi:hypothetical protein